MPRPGRVMLLGIGALLAWTEAHARQAAAAPDSFDAAARELVQVFEPKKMAGEMGDAAIEAQLQTNPQLAPYADILRSWVRKVFTEMDLEAELVKLYKQTFTEQELRDLIAFYRTPTGRKAVKTMPELMQKAMSIGGEQAKAHTPELMALIEKRQQELNAKPAADGKPPADTNPPKETPPPAPPPQMP